MKIALLGYGAMGKEIHELAASQQCEVTAIYTEDNPLRIDDTGDWEVAIDFTTPDSVLGNAAIVASLNKALVIGTTGWYERMSEILSIQESTQTGIVWGSNFSIGVHVFFQLTQLAGQLVNVIDSYDVMLHELHHVRKKDSPSGTALSAAHILIDELQRKTHVQTETQHNVILQDALHVTSTRIGEVIGKHIIVIDGPLDTIEISHNAKSRKGFAGGALLAAKWIHQRKGLYDFKDIFTQILHAK